MNEPDDENVGLSVGWSRTGFNAKVKSRFLSALDRLGGRRIDEGGLHDERRIAAHKAITEAQVALITAAAQTMTKDIESNPELAKRVLQRFSKAEREGENVDACLTLAFEDLRNREGALPEYDTGPDELDSATLDRWQHYAGGATSEQLRERWGRVLAAEVRTPGTFNAKCLRIVDELDAEDAKLFERFCMERVVTWIPNCTTSLSEQEVERLQEAGLVVKSELGRTIGFKQGSAMGKSAWFLHVGAGNALVLRADARLPMNGGLMDVLLSDKGTPCLPVHALSEAGVALASILPDHTNRSVEKLAGVIQALSEEDAVWLYKQVEEGRMKRVDRLD